MSAPGDLGWEAYPPEGVSTCESLQSTAEIHQSTQKKKKGKKTMIKISVLAKFALSLSDSTFAKDFTRKQFDMEATVKGFMINAKYFLTIGYLSFF